MLIRWTDRHCLLFLLVGWVVGVGCNAMHMVETRGLSTTGTGNMVVIKATSWITPQTDKIQSLSAKALYS